MATRSVETARGTRTGTLLLASVANHGTATHPYFRSEALSRGPELTRNLADIIHFLCALHGRHPGIVDHAATRTVEPAGRAWLKSAAEAMVDERVYLTRLAVARGPTPRTPGRRQTRRPGLGSTSGSTSPVSRSPPGRCRARTARPAARPRLSPSAARS